VDPPVSAGGSLFSWRCGKRRPGRGAQAGRDEIANPQTSMIASDI